MPNSSRGATLTLNHPHRTELVANSVSDAVPSSTIDAWVFGICLVCSTPAFTGTMSGAEPLQIDSIVLRELCTEYWTGASCFQGLDF